MDDVKLRTMVALPDNGFTSLPRDERHRPHQRAALVLREVSEDKDLADERHALLVSHKLGELGAVFEDLLVGGPREEGHRRALHARREAEEPVGGPLEEVLLAERLVLLHHCCGCQPFGLGLLGDNKFTRKNNKHPAQCLPPRVLPRLQLQDPAALGPELHGLGPRACKGPARGLAAAEDLAHGAPLQQQLQLPPEARRQQLLAQGHDGGGLRGHDRGVAAARCVEQSGHAEGLAATGVAPDCPAVLHHRKSALAHDVEDGPVVPVPDQALILLQLQDLRVRRQHRQLQRQQLLEERRTRQSRHELREALLPGCGR
mmetsp:Transcript_30844/g.88409  ORF Transcript_30844/g.88409 Transcript_30844/m.88409 type:complete len:316 (+) Transcript_30844:1249-2196(+)